MDLEDEDVTAEAQRVAQGADGDILRVSNLRKVYAARGNAPEKVAVDSLSVGVGRGECFGLLGINGAGKTSTMSMLTGDVLPTSGGATVDGADIVSDLVSVRQRIGYCPQFDPLIEEMTGRETLRMYAQLKSVPAELVETVVDVMLIRVGLSAHS